MSGSSGSLTPRFRTRRYWSPRGRFRRPLKALDLNRLLGSSKPRYAGLLLATIGILASCSACSSQTTIGSSGANNGNGTGTRTKDVVAVVGDSITHYSEASIRRSLAPYDDVIKAVPGAHIGQMLGAIKRLANSDPAPQDWILNLGTDDASFDDTSWHTHFKQMIADTTYASCVILVTINTHADQIGGTEIAAKENAAIEKLHRNDPSKYLYIDWNGLVHNEPGLLRTKGIHPTLKGQRTLAEWYKLALGQCPS